MELSRDISIGHDDLRQDGEAIRTWEMAREIADMSFNLEMLKKTIKLEESEEEAEIWEINPQYSPGSHSLVLFWDFCYGITESGRRLTSKGIRLSTNLEGEKSVEFSSGNNDWKPIDREDVEESLRYAALKAEPAIYLREKMHKEAEMVHPLY